MVIIDPSGECAYLLPHIEKHHYTILKTESSNKEECQRIKEELMLRYEADSKHKAEKVVFYVTRPKIELSFLIDYCYTHGCVDLSNPLEWLRKKLFASTGHKLHWKTPCCYQRPNWASAKTLLGGKDSAKFRRVSIHRR